MQHVNILLTASVPEPLTYGVPEGMAVQKGSVVIVPLGKKQVVGVVMGESSAIIAPEKLKYIIQLCDIPPLKDSQLKLIDWVANYTLSAPSTVLKMVLSVPQTLEKPPLETVYMLGDIEAGSITQKRQTVIDVLTDNAILSISELKVKSGVSTPVIHKMAELGMLTKKMRPQQTLEQDIEPPAPPTLSKEQQLAASVLCQMVNEETYSTTLLDGVTGSGKTEVYLAAVEEALKGGGQALVMLPEIILTNQIVNRFKRRFGFEPTLWHSHLTPKQRQENYRAIAQGTAKLVVGARSALFLPYRHLKLLIVDEEHDASYKQEEGVVYQARDMSVVRARFENIPLLLVSATPSIETLRNVESGKYNVLHLTSRHAGAVLPKINVVDMRKQSLGSTKWISRDLQHAINATLEAGKQSLLFINRRGYAPLSVCRNCGHRFKCSNCTSWLVEHRASSQLLCHHCGYSEPIVKHCPECNAENSIVPCGPGAERLAEEVSALFPDANVAQMTSDTVTNAKEAASMVDAITHGDVDIIIGTQMIAKGHHFPNLKLVGIIDADLGLSGGDLRAAERSYQLLHQVSGRAGREDEQGQVVIQSYMPENAVIQALANGERNDFFQNESTSRELTQMPPYARLAAIIISAKQAMIAQSMAKQLAKNAPFDNNVSVLGPVEAPIFQLRGKYRYRLLVRTPTTINLQKWIKRWLATVKVPHSVKLKVDIDPYNFM